MPFHNSMLLFPFHRISCLKNENNESIKFQMQRNLKILEYPYIVECKITRSLIWDRLQLWNSNIDNQCKYWCISNILWHFRAMALSGNALCDQYIQTNPHEAAVELANRLECSSEKGEDIGMYWLYGFRNVKLGN